jgi:hypothetical protein
MSKIFLIPNEDKNVKLIEEESGLRMYYVLSCPKDFPNISFISKNKAYYQKHILIPYGNNMSKRINYAYEKLKVNVMCDLAEFKCQFYQNKFEQLYKAKCLLQEYK